LRIAHLVDIEFSLKLPDGIVPHISLRMASFALGHIIDSLLAHDLVRHMRARRSTRRVPRFFPSAP